MAHHDPPKIHVSVEIRKTLPNYEHEIYTMGVSHVPYDATPADIDLFLDTGETVLHMARERLLSRIDAAKPKINLSAFDAEPETDASQAARETFVESLSAVSRPESDPDAEWLKETAGLREDPTAEEYEAALEAVQRESRIPDETEVETEKSAFGIAIPMPPAEWAEEPITEICADGRQGGQLAAVNAALTEMGYKNGSRHDAATALLFGFGTRDTAVSSTRDLTKYEASLILEWCSLADAKAKGKLSESCGQAVLI